MATIQIGGNPSAWGDRNRSGVHDDEAPTDVTVTTTVSNTGTANGRVMLRVGVLRSGQEDVTSWPQSTGWITVQSPNNSDENTVNLTLSYRVPDDQVQIVVGELRSEDGSLYQEESLSVNSFITPTNPDLRASQIRFTVT